MSEIITPEWLALVAGAVLSLLFSYVPGLSNWYAALDGTRKRLLMAGLLLVVAAGAFGLGCAGVLAGVDCSRNGAINIVYAYILALMANQSTYAISPQRR